MRTQKQAILEYLQEGHSITPLVALREFGSLRLAAVIHQLKSEGHHIISTPKPVKTRMGESTVAEYRLLKKAPSALAYRNRRG